LAPLQSDGLRSIEHTQQRATAPAGQMFGHRPYQGFDFFILDQTDAHPARILQTRSEEMNALARTVKELHVYFSEIVLAELSGKTFETYQRLGRVRTKRGRPIIEPGLAPLISRLSHPSQDLQRCY